MSLPRRSLWLLPVLVALLLGLQGLERWPLWSAELWSVEIAPLPDFLFWGLLLGDRHPPLHYLVLRALAWLSTADWLMRLPSLVGAVGAVALSGAAAERLLGRGAGLPVGLLLALNPLLVAQAGTARAYALLACACSLALWGAVTLPQQPRRGGVALGLGSAVALYLHYAAALPVTALALGALALALGAADRRAALRAWVAAEGAAFLAFLPWALVFLPGHLAKVPRTERSWRVLSYALWPLDEFISLPAALLAVVALLGIAVALWRRRPLLVVAGLLALALPWLASSSADMQRRVYAHIGFMPLWALLGTGACVLPFRRRPLVGVGLATGLSLLLVPTALGIARLPSSPYGPHGGATDDGIFDARQDARLLAGLLQPGQRVLTQGELWVGLYQTYAPGRFAASDTDDPKPADWLAIDPRLHRRDPASCLSGHAFPFLLEGPRGDACDALRAALEQAAAPRYLYDLAELPAYRDRREALLRQAAAHSPADAEPGLELVKLLVREDRPAEALDALGPVLHTALAWRQLNAAASLLELRGRALDALGAPGSDDAIAAARCVGDLPVKPLLPELCMWSATRSLAEHRGAAPRQRRRGGPRGRGQRR